MENLGQTGLNRTNRVEPGCGLSSCHVVGSRAVGLVDRLVCELLSLLN